MANELKLSLFVKERGRTSFVLKKIEHKPKGEVELFYSVSDFNFIADKPVIILAEGKDSISYLNSIFEKFLNSSWQESLKKKTTYTVIYKFLDSNDDIFIEFYKDEETRHKRIAPIT